MCEKRGLRAHTQIAREHAMPEISYSNVPGPEPTRQIHFCVAKMTVKPRQHKGDHLDVSTQQAVKGTQLGACQTATRTKIAAVELCWNVYG